MYIAAWQDRPGLKETHIPAPPSHQPQAGRFQISTKLTIAEGCASIKSAYCRYLVRLGPGSGIDLDFSPILRPLVQVPRVYRGETAAPVLSAWGQLVAWPSACVWFQSENQAIASGFVNPPDLYSINPWEGPEVRRPKPVDRRPSFSRRRQSLLLFCSAYIRIAAAPAYSRSCPTFQIKLPEITVFDPG